jgi:hypothetical protein
MSLEGAKVRVGFLPTALVLVLVYGLAQTLWGERIPLTGGLGTYDGRRYGEIARDFHREVFEDGLDLFRLQRILPSALVHAGLGAAGSGFDNGDLVRGFLLLNLLSQLALVVVWDRLARAGGLGPRGWWVGLGLLLLNFANLKQPYFYPVLTDTPAVLLGALALLFHLQQRTAALAAVLLVAAFTWPSLFVSGSLLFVASRVPVDGPAPPALPRALLSAVAALVLPLLHTWLLAPAPWGPRVVASLALLAVYAAALAWTLLGSARLFDLRTYAAAVRPWKLPVVVLAFLVLRLALTQASTAPGMTYGRHLRHLFLYNAGQPGLFLLAHVVYFGPVVLAVLLLWPTVRTTLHRLGLGVTAYAAFHLAHGINTESRQLVDALPLLALVAARAIEERGVPARAAAGLAVLGAVLSKAWLPINQTAWAGPYEHPAQLYFMNMGPSMTRESVALQAAAALAALLLVWLLLRPRPAAAPAPAATSG